MFSSAVSKLKRKERGNISVIRRSEESSFASEADEKWLFENRLAIIKMTETAVSSLREVKSLPAEHGEPRIMSICGKIAADSSFVLNEEIIISHINDFQRENSYLTVGELLYLSAYFQFVCVDMLADGIRDGTLYRASDAVRLMLALRDIDFERIYETVSYSESVFIRDPADVYVHCDGATKSMYRRKLAEISRRFHMGEYETSKLILKNAEDSEGRARHIGWHILKYSRHTIAAAIYFPTLYLVPAVIVGVLACVSYSIGITTLFFASLLSYLPLREFIKLLADKIFSRAETPDILPRLSLDDIPPEGRTLLTYTVSLSGEDNELFDRLKMYAEAYKCPGLGFAVLADLPDADAETTGRDAETVAYAKRRIDEINADGGCAYFFYRKREKSASEGRYIGPERKRGAQSELFSLLSGGRSSLSVYGGAPVGYKYVLALDADTEILFSDIKKLIATALHPCCEPFISRSSGYPIVTDGYGVIAPVAQVSQSDAKTRSVYTAYRYAYGGRSEYERSSYSTYAYLFGTGSFCGKGLIHIDAYMKTVYGAFPRERILSHDTAEGVRLRCGHASDVRVYDGVPKDYLGERSRAHRWMRGDVQALCLLRRGIPSSAGERYKNPVSITGRLIMIEPVISASTSTVRPAAILLSLIGKGPLGLLLYLISVSDHIYKAASLAVSAYNVPFRRYYSGIPNYYSSAAFEIFFAFASSADAAFNTADAQYRAIYRMRISKKRLLEWKTAASSDREKHASALTYLKKMWPSVTLGAASMISVIASRGVSLFILPLYGAGWIIFPMWMHAVNGRRAFPSASEETELPGRGELLHDAELMWKYYSDNVKEKYNYLPPDNVSILPEPRIAERTSPTNIGLYLLSATNAYDLGFISAKELKTRLEDTLGTVFKLEKRNGCLYNWYNIKTLEVLYPAYVSTVDIGNFTVCLLTVKNAVRGLDGFDGIAKRASELINEVDFSSLYNKKRGLFHIGFNSVLGEYDRNVYDLYTGEILTTSFFAASRGDVPADHISSLGRIRVDESGRETTLSWSGSAFEYFMPAIFLPVLPGTERYETLASAYEAQIADGVIIDGKTLYGRSESSFYDFDDEGNYSYKAHGSGALAVSPDISGENVLAPYSIYLLAQFNVGALDAAAQHRGGDLYGKYGFYESVDVTPSRVGRDYGVARLYMAHHIGMSIAAAANVLLSDINVRRFCEEPFIRASLPLLYESVGINRHHAEERSKIQADAHLPASEAVVPGSIAADSAVVSNGRIKIIAQKKGGIAVYDGETLLTEPIMPGCQNVDVLLRTEGEVFSCIRGQRTQFSTDGMAVIYTNEIVCGEKIIKTELTAAVSPLSPSAFFELKVTGVKSADILYMFSPVMNRCAAYESAPSYSDLFLIAERTDKNTVRFVKKTSPGERAELFFRVLGGERDNIRLFTKKDELLPFAFDGDDIRAVFDIDGGMTDGACVHPVFAAVLTCRDMENGYKSGVMISSGEPPQDLSPVEVRAGMEKHLRLRTSLSGANPASVRCAMELAGVVADGAPRIIECDGVPDVKYRKDIFWRYGISGDLPIVAVFTSDLSLSADTFAVSELITAKRFLFLSGVRFDLVFISPASGYLGGGTGKLRQMIRSGGSEKLFGKNNGIFLIDRESLSEAEELVFIASSCKYFDVGTDHRFTVGKADVKSGIDMIRRKMRRPISCRIEGDAAYIGNGRNASPYSMVYANPTFGALVTNMTCGYSWYMNSSMSTVSRRHIDPMLGSAGETVLISVDGENFDLASSAETVIWERGCAIYKGHVGIIDYELRVGVDAKLPVKLYHLKIDGEDKDVIEKTRAGLIFRPSSSAVCRKGHISLMSDAAARAYIFSVSAEISDAPENLGDSFYLRCAFSSGECGFCIAAYPAGERCAAHIRDKYRRAELFGAGFEEYETRVNSILLSNVYRGGDGFLSGILGFTAYQAVFVRMLARSGYSQSGGAFGFRDQLQDSLAALYFRPELTKLQILRSCARQYEDGRVQHWWHAYPYGGGLRSRCSDDYMWLPYVTAEYVLSTGDQDILSYRTPFLTSKPLEDGESDRYEKAAAADHEATVLEHCITALKSSFNIGEHGLPLIGSGDWNDGMNEVGVNGRGESVWLAFFFAVVYRRFSEMLDRYAIDPIFAERLLYEADTLVTSAEMTSWDGGWYVRAFDDDGGVIGSEKCRECKIDLLPQAFSVFANADRERSRTALRCAVERLYDEEYGIVRLFEPSYDETEKHGYICRYPAGIRENGGQYTHGALWLAAALFASGDREAGIKLLSSLSPVRIYADGRMDGKYTAEPYFTAADVYFGGDLTGHSGWSGYTGSAAWFYRIAMKYYLGIKLDGGCVVISPSADADFTVSVRASGCEMTIRVGSEVPEECDADEKYSVDAGGSVTVRPSGERLKICVKVKK